MSANRRSVKSTSPFVAWPIFCYVELRVKNNSIFCERVFATHALAAHDAQVKRVTNVTPLSASTLPRCNDVTLSYAQCNVYLRFSTLRQPPRPFSCSPSATGFVTPSLIVLRRAFHKCFRFSQAETGNHGANFQSRRFCSHPLPLRAGLQGSFFLCCWRSCLHRPPRPERPLPWSRGALAPLLLELFCQTSNLENG